MRGEIEKRPRRPAVEPRELGEPGMRHDDSSAHEKCRVSAGSARLPKVNAASVSATAT
jgi:hypothetical protein